MAGPQNAIVSDYDTFEVPETKVDEKQLDEEKKSARYSKSAEYKRLKEHFEARILFYQTSLPDGRDIGASQPTAEDWRVANSVIKELQYVINFYETAAETVKNAEKN